MANSSGKIGLMSLSANEQLEICTPNAISFSEMEYFYPVMNSEEHLTQFDNSTGTESIRYTLEDGEYLYYTDQYMLSYAYFGPGTEITIPASVSIKPTETTITASDIVTSGISVIPWVKYNPINATEDKHVSGLEYKYLTLTSGDILSECNVTSGELDET